MRRIYENEPYGRQIDGSGAYLGIVGHAQRPSGTFAWFAEDRGGWKRWYLTEALAVAALRGETERRAAA